MKEELLVIAYQHGAVKWYSGFVQTARHVLKIGLRKADFTNFALIA